MVLALLRLYILLLISFSLEVSITYPYPFILVLGLVYKKKLLVWDRTMICIVSFPLWRLVLGIELGFDL